MRRLSLRDRTVIVTGASSGLGRALAVQLAETEGAQVILAARRRDRLEELAVQIAASGGRAWPVPVDLGEPDGPARLIAASAELSAPETPFGLVNNAGITEFGRFLDLDAQRVDRLLAVNVRAAIELTRLFVGNAMTPNSDRLAALSPNPRCAVLTIASMASFVPVPYQAVYAATKHALLGFGESVAAELSPSVAVTTFAPGGIETEMVEQSGINDVIGKGFLAPPELIAVKALRAWKRGRLSATAGLENRTLRLLGRLLPHRVIGRRAERFYRP